MKEHERLVSATHHQQIHSLLRMDVPRMDLLSTCRNIQRVFLCLKKRPDDVYNSWKGRRDDSDTNAATSPLNWEGTGNITEPSSLVAYNAPLNQHQQVPTLQLSTATSEPSTSTSIADTASDSINILTNINNSSATSSNRTNLDSRFRAQNVLITCLITLRSVNSINHIQTDVTVMYNCMFSHICKSIRHLNPRNSILCLRIIRCVFYINVIYIFMYNIYKAHHSQIIML